MVLVEATIDLQALREMSKKMFGNLVKAVVDIERELMVVDADLHADQEAFLLERESKQEHLWGINLYPDLTGEDFIEFDSMINIRPSHNNRSRSVEDPDIRAKIITIVHKRVLL